MHITVNNPYSLVHELRLGPALTDVPLHSEDVTRDLVEIIEEACVWGLLAGKLPVDANELRVDVELTWVEPPIVDEVRLDVSAGENGQRSCYTRTFRTGRWVRTALEIAGRLREEGRLAVGQLAHRMLIALKRDQPPALAMPPLQPPPIVDASLAQAGVRQLGAGSLLPDRPVLVSKRMVDDCIRRCEESGVVETGAAVLGKTLRLAEPLPGTETPIVTLLSAIVEDPRHSGAPLTFTFSPEGLNEAARFADLRAMHESVLTVFHTHGWSTACGNCNQNANCPLAECGPPSLQDYRLLESLLSAKTTLMPIAGRKLGETARRPVLQIHAWRGGEMQPIPYQVYHE